MEIIISSFYNTEKLIRAVEHGTCQLAGWRCLAWFGKAPKNATSLPSSGKWLTLLQPPFYKTVNDIATQFTILSLHGCKVTQCEFMEICRHL